MVEAVMEPRAEPRADRDTGSAEVADGSGATGGGGVGEVGNGVVGVALALCTLANPCDISELIDSSGSLLHRTLTSSNTTIAAWGTMLIVTSDNGSVP
jgi:hypothetical protein